MTEDVNALTGAEKVARTESISLNTHLDFKAEYDFGVVDSKGEARQQERCDRGARDMRYGAGRIEEQKR